MKVRFAVVGLLVLFSCSTKQQNADSGESESQSNEAILYRNDAAHNFSSLTDVDTFRIYVTGKSIGEGEFTFQIVDSKGQLLLDEKFATTYLVDYEFNKDVDTMEAYMKKRIDSFFAEDQFSQPAIAPDEELDESFSDKATWEDIKSDPTAIGFHYLLGKEDGRHIAWSKKLKKVVMYFNCC